MILFSQSWIPILFLQSQNLWSSLSSTVVPMVLIFGIFYVLMILPMQRQQKALQQRIENMKKGDRVITKGGLYGEVAAIDGTTSVVLKIADTVRVKVLRSAIAAFEGEDDKDKGANS
jgi:preprotein translocase subunit YajC